jgi:hypothetical protein
LGYSKRNRATEGLGEFARGGVSWAHSVEGDILPDGVTLGAELSISGGGKEVSTRTEVVGNGAERPEETLDVLGALESLEYTLGCQ